MAIVWYDRGTARIRKRRIAIVALVVAVLAAAWLLSGPVRGDAFFDYLARHPSAYAIVEGAAWLWGVDDEFDARISEAEIRRMVAEGRAHETIDLPATALPKL